MGYGASWAQSIMPYPIPPKPADPRLTCRRVFIPDQIDIISVLFGQLAEMCNEEYWSQGTSDWDVEDLTQLLRQGLSISNQNESCVMICEVVWTVANVIPDGWLLADGSTILIADYPEYAAACDPALLISVTEAKLPSLVNRFAIGAGDTYNVDETGGEIEHTLTVSEMPSHTHSETAYTSNIDIESAGVPDPFAIGLPTFPSSTGSTGGDNAHNNMPPYYGIKPIVRVLP